MTAISSAAAGGSSYLSPLQLLQKELASEVSSGTVKSSDADALSSALQDIDSSLQSSRSSSSSDSRPTDLKSKIDDLIASEVSSGKLTTDQATELQNVFKNTFAGGPPPGGGAGGPPPDDGTSASSSSTSTDSSSSDISDILKQFLQLLQDQKSSTANAYGASGSAAASGSFTALLINYQT
ncbi:hypothetical protein [Rhodopseudomonas palustris]|uniref:Uncharacterized protein n=1 Tax=Rhodopseudomonas palustris (strain ATCC BAA-98 / CGA009) TaxID=258594 RepID=Q6N3X3_RHOPA|nr:hypothetical protein [Rhodopseudomonas palustris]ACF02584.1 conserved hypothetical protein [Rhodopseudomonas palustris TIE-1]OPF97628.1 hypothetical protein B1S06_00195 [Rhodopseudomonas palustris]PPQ42840.1 hypothetical protein CKO39_14960 [Rhodopseudomonas palustris]QQM05116.1 hypothetical protein I8G32_03684 [Rhodopseudomonas palustris]RJF69257.1 hypothetical protein D4Q71_01365 [Rhodopseudomonas palustris]